jgi:glycogen(starch) synthase
MRVAILAVTPLARDARVMRTAGALQAAGHDVVVIGRAPLPTDAAVRFRPLPELKSEARQRLELVLTQGPATLLPPLASPLYWAGADRARMLHYALQEKPDVVVSNDWITLPVATRIKRATGARIVYDSHEFAVREHVQNWKWRIIARAAVQHIERHHIGSADRVMTVSDGIADALQALYTLPERPTVIRNLPQFQDVPPRPRGLRRRILFHGVIRPERGLEELIDSIPRWRFDGEIIIRGYGSAAYIAGLRDRAAALGAADRLVIAPAVSPAELVEQAADADIGYLALPPTTEQYEFALPNKLFEYMMAGLAVLATPRLEMRRIVEATGSGVLADLTPEKLADALNGIGVEQLDQMREAGRAAARRLNWDEEQKSLVALVDGLANAAGRAG